jgi:hypothetical protein
MRIRVEGATMEAGQGRLEMTPMRCMEIRGGNLAVEELLDAPGLQEWVYSRPYKSAAGGGDVHYLSLCASGTISRLILADVSGHGDEVSGFAVALRSLMEKNINVKDQTRLVERLNRQFAEIAETQRFATAVVATYLTADRSLTICNAGHPRPLWRRAESDTWQFLGLVVGEVGNLPWGLDDETPYQQFSMHLGRGDLVLFYTDALIEAADPTGRQLGEEGLLTLARGVDAEEPWLAGRALLDAVAAHRGGREADDDVTIVAWHHNGNGPRDSAAREEFDAYAKMVEFGDFEAGPKSDLPDTPAPIAGARQNRVKHIADRMREVFYPELRLRDVLAKCAAAFARFPAVGPAAPTPCVRLRPVEEDQDAILALAGANRAEALMPDEHGDRLRERLGVIQS